MVGGKVGLVPGFENTPPGRPGGPGGPGSPGGPGGAGGAVAGGPTGVPGRELVLCPLLPRPKAMMSRSSWSGAPE